jgi:cytochrome c biogenesis protein CcdA
MTSVLFTLAMSLFDSISTTQQIVIFILLLTTNKPLRNGCWYLAGLCGSYIACGIAGYLTLDQLRMILGRFFPSSSAIPDPLYYQSEFIAGMVMTVLGFWYYRNKKRARPGRAENFILAKLKSMNSPVAFGIGVFISVSSFPMSIPYLVSLEKYALLHTGLVSAIGYILLYNIGYALPMLAVLVVYLIASRGTDIRHDALHEKARALNIQLTTWALAGFGVFSMVDAGCYFAFGRALIKGRYY